MRSRRLSNLAWAMLAPLLAPALALVPALGCARPRIQREVLAPGTPSHIDGPALVLLPRTCMLDRYEYGNDYGHDGSTRSRARGARTSLELRRAVDAMVAGVRSTTLPVDACSPPPDLTTGAARLADLRASRDVLRMMNERGVRHAVVIQIKTRLVCADEAGSALYAGGGFGMGTPYIARDECDEEHIDLSALVFAADGAALWAGTRAIEPGAPVETEVERLLRRVPVTIPLRSRHDGPDLRCRLEEHGVVDCT